MLELKQRKYKIHKVASYKTDSTYVIECINCHKKEVVHLPIHLVNQIIEDYNKKILRSNELFHSFYINRELTDKYIHNGSYSVRLDSL